MQNTFNLPVGYSDHSPGYIVPLGAVALGASVIEKHITFNRNLKGPDHPFALEVEEFSEMIKKIRELEKALGDGKKRPVLEELPERKFARRGLYAKSDISKGVYYFYSFFNFFESSHSCREYYWLFLLSNVF